MPLDKALKKKKKEKIKCAGALTNQHTAHSYISHN